MNLWYTLSQSINYFLPWGGWGLFVLAFMEASFFPVPPDALLIPLAILRPGRAIWYAAITTVGSVMGGYFGYVLGVKFGRPLLRRLISEVRMQQVDDLFQRWGGWAVLAAALTPIPYKVFTIAAGIARINLITFGIASLAGRALRFFAEGVVIFILGPMAQTYLAEYLDVGTVVLLAVLVAGYLLVRMVQARRPVVIRRQDFQKARARSQGVLASRNSRAGYEGYPRGGKKYK